MPKEVFMESPLGYPAFWFILVAMAYRNSGMRTMMGAWN